MASLNKAINKEMFANILPEFGKPRIKVPVWDNSQKMFIFDEHESASGNHYYCGIRFCNHIAVVEKVGIFHSWTYIDSIEIYAFNGKCPELIQKRDYQKVFRNEEFIRHETADMLKDYFVGMAKAQRQPLNMEYAEQPAEHLVDMCYKSFLDSDYNTRLTEIIPALKQE